MKKQELELLKEYVNMKVGGIAFDRMSDFDTGILPITPGAGKEQDRPQAVCALLIKGDLVLAVSRKNDSTAMGLPGGVVEPGEDLLSAVERELKEETGIDAVSFEPVFVDFDGIYEVTTFACDFSDQKISSSEEGKVEWVHPKTLLRGPFGEYNKKLFITLGWKV